MRFAWLAVISVLGVGAAASGMHILSINPASVVGEQSATATLRLAQDAASGPSVHAVQVSDTSVASAPATVSVPAGSTITTFTVTTRPVTTTRTVTITAAGASTTLTVRAPSLVKFIVSDSVVRRGGSVKGSLGLDGAAPNAGTVVFITVTSASGTQPPGVTFPPAVVVPAGQSTVSFPITVERTASAGTITVTAILRGVSLMRDIAIL